MGSEKYPAENGFDAFLKKHGGSDNASTDCERTIFQFDVQRKYFREALDRWAPGFLLPAVRLDMLCECERTPYGPLMGGQLVHCRRCEALLS